MLLQLNIKSNKLIGVRSIMYFRQGYCLFWKSIPNMHRLHNVFHRITQTCHGVIMLFAHICEDFYWIEIWYNIFQLLKNNHNISWFFSFFFSLHLSVCQFNGEPSFNEYSFLSYWKTLFPVIGSKLLIIY